MDYHEHNISQDGIIRMSTDGSTFRDVEEKWTHFKEEPHNVTLSLEADGVNQYIVKRSIYLVSPIFVINNNIPP